MMTMASRSAVGMELCAICGCAGLFVAAIAAGVELSSFPIHGAED